MSRASSSTKSASWGRESNSFSNGRRGPADSSRFSEELLESENDRKMQNVASKVSTLKHVALDLRTEAKEQVRLVNDSEGFFDTASSLLNGSFTRVKGLRIIRVQNCKYMWYFSLIAVVFLLIMYLLIGRVMAS